MPKKRAAISKTELARVVTIDQWFESQDEAVDLEYRKLKRKVAPDVPAKDTRTEDQKANDRALKSVLDIIDRCQQCRRDLEEDGYCFDYLLRIVRAGDMINQEAIKLFENGRFDEGVCPSASNREIRVTRERMSGTPISLFSIDGKSVLLGTIG